jgi:hypothetical protein
VTPALEIHRYINAAFPKHAPKLELDLKGVAEVEVVGGPWVTSPPKLLFKDQQLRYGKFEIGMK